MRRHYITHPRFQTWFTISFVEGTFIVFTLLAGLFLFSFYILAKQSFVTDAQRALIFSQMTPYFLIFTLMWVITALIYSFVGIFLSYKFVGPLNRLEKWLEDQIEKPNGVPLHLRPGDELEETVSAIQDILQAHQPRQ